MSQPSFQLIFGRRMIVDHVSILLLQVGAMLSAVQLRLQLPVGAALGTEYIAQPPFMYVVILVGTLIGTYAGVLFRRTLKRGRSRRLHYINLVIATGVSFLGVALFLPDVSLLQNLYFVLLSVLFGLMTIWWTPVLPDAGEESSLFRHLQRLWDRRALLRLWTVSNIEARYSQAVLGILWIIVLPVSQALILTIVFSQIIRDIDAGGVPFIAFFLTALTFWSFFQQAIMNSTSSVLSAMGVIVQVYFPREILVLVRLFEAMVDLLFMFMVMLILNAFVGVFPTFYFIYLPLIFVVQLVFMLGLMLFLSYISVLVRDVPQLVSIVMQFLFYLTPILFPASMVPDRLRFIIILNPLAGLIQAYRDVLVYHKAPDMISLYYPIVMGGILLYMGYLFFKSNELNLADYV